MTGMRFLITGGAGFIGSHLVEALLERGYFVRVLDNFSTGKRENLAPYDAEIEVIEGDLRDIPTVRKAVAGVDVVLHQAALPSVPRSIIDPVSTHEVNATGTLNVLEAARHAGVRRVVFASSSSIYGDSPELPKHEGMRPNPRSPYAVSKLAGEAYCQVFSRFPVEALLERGHFVRVLDNFSTGKRENLAPYDAEIEVIEGDLRDIPTVRKAVAGVDVVLHQAALPSVPRSIIDPVSTHEVNATGTLNVLEAARHAGVRRVVFASSSSIYGDSPELPKHEGMRPNPRSPYAVSKMAGEAYCQVFSNVYGLETVALRYFNVFGTRQDPNSPYAAVIPKFIEKMLNDKRPIVYGDGEQSRDFTHVANVVQANLFAATGAYDGGLVVNCAFSSRTTINDLIATLNRILGKELEPIYEAPRPGDVKHSYADISLAREKLKYTPGIDLQRGLALLIHAETDAGSTHREPVNLRP